MKENAFFIDKVKAVVGDRVWESLSEEAKKRILFDKFCPAGGLKEENYLNDGARYWEKQSGNNTNRF